MRPLCLMGFIACAVALAAPAFSADHPAVAEWNRYCFLTHDSPAIGLALADTDGWKKAAIDEAEKYYSGQARKKVDALGQHLLGFSQLKRSIAARDDLHMLQCVVTVPSSENPVPSLIKLLGAPPLYADERGAHWMLMEADDIYSIPSESDIGAVQKAQAEGRLLRIHAGLTIYGAGTQAFIIFEPPRPILKK
jgi:hypothetical protein